MSDFDKDVQEKIEEELFEEYDKILDRIFSLIKFIFVIFGFYTVILNDMHNGLSKDIFINAPDPDISTISILLCFLSIIIAIAYLFTILVSEQKYKFKMLDNLIQYRKEGELKKNNLEMFLQIKKMNSHYKSSVYLIGVSLFLFCCYIRPWLFYSFLAVILPFIIIFILKLRAKVIEFFKLSIS